jgi:hypothetical protein
MVLPFLQKYGVVSESSGLKEVRGVGRLPPRHVQHLGEQHPTQRNVAPLFAHGAVLEASRSSSPANSGVHDVAGRAGASEAQEGVGGGGEGGASVRGQFHGRPYALHHRHLGDRRLRGLAGGGVQGGVAKPRPLEYVPVEEHLRGMQGLVADGPSLGWGMLLLSLTWDVVSGSAGRRDRREGLLRMQPVHSHGEDGLLGKSAEEASHLAALISLHCLLHTDR